MEDIASKVLLYSIRLSNSSCCSLRRDMKISPGEMQGMLNVSLIDSRQLVAPSRMSTRVIKQLVVVEVLAGLVNVHNFFIFFYRSERSWRQISRLFLVRTLPSWFGRSGISKTSGLVCV